MSERPTDWSALDYGSDPVPGDPAQVRADVDAARGRYQAAGDALVEYAHVHDAAQQTTLRALYAARSAKRDVADA